MYFPNFILQYFMFSSLQIDERHRPLLSTVFAVFLHEPFRVSSVVFIYPPCYRSWGLFNPSPSISFLSLLSGLSVLSWGEGNDFGLMMKSFRGKTLLEGKKEHFLLGDAHVSVNWELQCWEFRWCTLNEKTKTFCPCVCVCVLTFLLHGKNMPFFWPSGRDSLIKELSPYTHTHTHTEFSEFEDECFYLLWSLWGRMHFCPVIFKKWLFRVEIETFFLPRDKHTYNFLWAEKQNVCLFVCSFSR